MRDFFKDQTRRLRAVRIACGFDKQIDFADELGITKGTWSDLENNNKPLSLELARQMKARWHLPLDFLLDGDVETIDLAPAKILRKLEELAASATV
jgi:transcriptional regulator with XRE-family HTH domain